MDNIDVVIRVRPFAEQESVWKNNEYQISSKEKDFKFDRIFGPLDNNLKIYDEIGHPIVEKVMQGINGTLFAYGQTASGKTHTIMGERDELGIVPLAVKDIFEHINKSPSREFLLRASYMEIYNEEINDLLDLNGADGVIKLRNNTNNEVVIDNLSEHSITCYEDVMSLLEQGIKSRKVGATNMNERSSRSHCIFRLAIESRALSDDANVSESTDDGAVIVSQLNLVDLAGSERASQTGAQGARLKESNHINTSLMTLGLVIRKLSNEVECNGYIPYRDSKLTRILQHSLGGNAKTTIIATVSPTAYEETTQTLMFAERAKNVANKPKVNEVLDGDTMLRRQKREIADLKKKIAELESGASASHHSDMDNKQKRMAHLLKQILCSGQKKEPKASALKPLSKRRQTCCPGEFRMREQGKNNMSAIDDFDLDDTTHCFEKWENKFFQEEVVEKIEEGGKENQELKVTISEKDNEIGGLLKIIKDLQDQVRDIETFKDVIESLGIENQVTQESLDSKTAENISLEGKVQQLENETKSLRDDNAIGKRQIDELLAEVSNLALVKEDLIGELENNKNKFLLSVQEINVQLKSQCNILDEREQCILALQGEIEEKDTVIKSKSNEICQMTTDIEAYKKTYEASLEEVNKSQDVIMMDEQLSRSEKILLEEKDEKCTQLASQIEDLYIEIETLKNEKQGVIKELSDKNSLIAEYKQLDISKSEKVLLEEKDEKCTQLASQIEDLNMEIETLKNEKQGVIKESYQIEELRNTKEEQEILITDLNRILLSKDDCLNEKNDNVDRLRKENMEMQRIIMEKDSKLAELTTRHSHQHEANEDKSDLTMMVEQFAVGGSEKVLLEESLLSELDITKARSDAAGSDGEARSYQVEQLLHAKEEKEILIEDLNRILLSKDDCLSEKNGHIDKLRTENMEMQRIIMEKESKLAELMTRHSHLQETSEDKSDIIMMEEQFDVSGSEKVLLEENADKCTQLASQIKDLGIEIDTLKNEKQELIKELIEKDSLLTELNITKAKSNAEEGDGEVQSCKIEQLLTTKEELEISIADLNRKLLCKEDYLSEKNDHIDKLTDENMKMQRIIMEKDDRISELTSRHSYQHETKEDKSDLTMMVEQFAVGGSEKVLLEESLLSELNMTKARSDAAESDGETRSHRIEQLLHTKEELEITIENLNGILSSKDDCLNEKNDHIDKLRDEKMEMQRVLMEKDSKLSELTAKYSELVTLQEKFEDIERENVHLREKAEEYIQLTAQIADLNKGIDILMIEKQEFIQEISDYKRTIRENSDEKSELLNQVKDCKTELQMLRAEEESHINEVNVLRGKIITLETEKETLLDELDTVNSQSEISKEEIESLKCKNTELSNKKDELEVSITDLHGELLSKDDSLSEKDDCISKLEEQNIQMESIISEHEGRIAELTNKCLSLEEKITEKIAEADRLRSSLKLKKEDINVYTERVREQEDVIKTLKEQIEVYKERNAKLDSDLKEIKDPRQNNDMKTLNKKIVDLEKNNFTLTTDLGNLQKSYDDLKEAEFGISCCKEKLEEFNKKLTSEVDALKKRIEDEKASSKRNLKLLSEKYEKSLAHQKSEQARIGEGLTTAYKKYKDYKELYLERDAECEKYRKMLEEVSMCVSKDSVGLKTSKKRQSEEEISTTRKKVLLETVTAEEKENGVELKSSTETQQIVEPDIQQKVHSSVSIDTSIEETSETKKPLVTNANDPDCKQQ